ncbi:hypothetical protein EYR36_009909 [Pleurotus pulmonarius]|nr:hypothetical protein EYR36_009909 [Pleurotus pulmonarius]
MGEVGDDDERTNVVMGVGRGAVDEVFEMRGIVDMTRDVVDITMGVVAAMGEEREIRVVKLGVEERDERTIDDDDGSSVGDEGDVSGGGVVEVYDDVNEEEEEEDVDEEVEIDEDPGEDEDEEEEEEDSVDDALDEEDEVSDIELDELLELVDDDDDTDEDDADTDDEDEIELG